MKLGKLFVIMVCLVMIVISAGLVSAAACPIGPDNPTRVWLRQGATLQIEDGEDDHQISIIDVSDNENACGINVNGEISWVYINQITKIDGVVVRVLDANIVSSAMQDDDDCELSYYCEAATCTDSDGGRDYYTKGSTRLSDGSGWNDDCRRSDVNGILVNTGELLEAVCTADGKTEYVTYNCQDGCEDGACLIDDSITCTDTDNGNYYNIKGTVSITDKSGVRQTHNDYCADSIWVNEYSCTMLSVDYPSVDSALATRRKECTYGCKDGACLKEPATPPSPVVCTTEYDPVCGRDGRTYSNKCVANSKGVQIVYRGECKETTYVTSQNLNRISNVWSDKRDYNVGEKMTVYAKIVDSDGTPATPEEGTSVGFGIMDFNGISIDEATFDVGYNAETSYYVGIVEVPDVSPARIVVTASKDSVTVANRDYYFKVIDASVYKTETTEQMRVIGEPTVPRYLGPPEEAPEGIYGEYEEKKKEITREELLRSTVSCFNGCAADSKCLPFGTRLLIDEEPSYCSISQSFESQSSEGDACQNNYECQSNQCSNGHCVDLEKELEETRGMLKKLMSWLGRLFGSDE